MALDPARTVAELRELRELTGDENGAQRVAWTETWERAREWLADSLARPAARGRAIDEAGNQWFTLRGESERAVLIGGHIDSVPNGGWLDGCLNVVAGVEVLRRIAERGQAAGHGPPRQLGRRGGRALRPLALRLVAPRPARWPTRTSCGSSRDRDGIALPDALAAHGVDLDRALDARPQLETRGRLPRAAHRAGPGARVARTCRSASCSAPSASSATGSPGRGQAAHAGSTPMDKRRDALAGAAKLALEIRDDRRARPATAPSARPAASSASRGS